MKKIFLSCFLGLGLALSLRAQGVFQATLATPDDGGGAQLILGNFWFQVVDGEVDFMVILPATGPFTSSLNPVLSVPGSSLEFSLGEGSYTELRGSHTYADHNPFLPTEPWLPVGYDEDGIPYYVDTHQIYFTDVYTGHFALPPEFLDELLAGNGKIELNSSIVGNITVATVPEPTTTALGLLIIGSVLFVSWHRRVVV